MTNTDWRSECLEMWEYRGEGEASVMGDGASDFLDFIEKTRIEAQIEVLEEITSTVERLSKEYKSLKQK